MCIKKKKIIFITAKMFFNIVQGILLVPVLTNRL